ncbi:inositol monophosphatase, partial [Candidatus Sumerlaeota bacterium]|nr:inositol monophosphatase [Candidatus Sumerlaeota bacterium]
MRSPATLLEPIRRLHELIRDRVLRACEDSSVEQMSGVDRDSGGDTIYSVDRVGEEVLVDFLTENVASIEPIVLTAEGLSRDRLVLPRGAQESDAVWRVIVVP